MISHKKVLQLAAGVALAVAGATANADERDMSVTIHSGYAGAKEILNGDFEVGERRTNIKLDSAERNFIYPSAILELRNNLCVSHIMQGNKSGALETCERAVHQATRTKAEGRQTRKSIRRLQAIAYQNRGVSHALSEHTEQAIDDFNAALRLHPELDAAAKNITLVHLAASRSAARGK